MQQVTFYPVPPVKPVVRQTEDQQAETARAQPQARPLTQSHVGRNLDLKV
ncbi:hypothetical protein [Phenylobacterium sp.]